jgi:hypothetical protein
MRYLVAYFGNRYLHHFARDLEEIREHGFDGVVHCVTEADREWGMSRIAEMFAMTRDAGLECWADPWAVGGVFGGEAHSAYRARGGATAAGDPGLRALVCDWIDAVAAAGAEWAFWDEPDLGLGQAPDALLSFLCAATEHAAARGLRNSVCLTSREANLPALRRLAALDSVHDVGTDPYYACEVGERDPDPEDHVGGWAERVRDAAAAEGKTSHVWVQAFHVAAGHEERIRRCLDIARSRGVTRVGVWGFRACEALDIRPGRPDVAWRVVGEALSGRAGSAARRGTDAASSSGAAGASGRPDGATGPVTAG